MSRPTALVVAGPGTNRDTDALLALDLAGAEPAVALIGELAADPRRLDAARIVVIAGGFSYGDALGAGRMLALDLTAGDGGRLGEQLRAFVAGGRPVVGICNGFQVLTRAALLPGALGHNQHGRFDCRWVELAAEPASHCIWTAGLADPLHSPIAHGEGRYVHPDPASLAADGQVALRYVGSNPNGSVAEIAGVCDPTGVVLGLMPHPENHVVARQHPRHRQDPTTTRFLGLRLFEAAVRHVSSPTLAPFTDVDLPLPDRRDGKVRTSYSLSDGRRLFVTTDRLSAFDRIIAGVPYKGQVLNQLAAWWFEQTADVVANHVLGIPDPNVLVATAATTLPVEVVVRRYITGVTSTSLWKPYAAGARTMYGYRFPDGLRKNTGLPRPIVTPTTKPTLGSAVHDEPLTMAEVVDRGLVDASRWELVTAAALELFRRGQDVASGAGLILADTKYEFGVTADGDILLIDEVHTPDSSRLWVAATYEERLAAGEEPESLDKEVVRRALADVGFAGDGELPTLPAEVWGATTDRYIDAYERLTGLSFEPGAYPVQERILARLDQGDLQ